MIHFDTNFLIYALRPGSPEEAKMRAWLAGAEVLRISSVAWAEFLCGPLTPKDALLAKQIFADSEPLLTDDAVRAAELFNQTGRRSRSLPDCMIAAVALRCGARLATNNLPDFQPFVPYGLLLA